MSICSGLRGGSTEIVGTSSGTPPYPRSLADRLPACSFVRGTRIRQPNSGLVSNHESDSRMPTTSPITVTAGDSMRAVRASAAISARVDTTVRCSVVVPTEVIDTGVSGSRPAAQSASAAAPMPLTADSSTSVWLSTWRAQSILPSARLSTVTSRDVRVVSGTPAYAGTAVTELIPGTTSNDTSAFAQAAASSAPVAYIHGSPTMRRTTFCWPRACRTTSLARDAWVSGWPSSPDPPSTTVTLSSRSPSSAASRSTWAGVSVITTSAVRIRSRARTVRSPGSPGPVPTNATDPIGRDAVARLGALLAAPVLPERAVVVVAGVLVAGVLAIVVFTLFL